MCFICFPISKLLEKNKTAHHTSISISQIFPDLVSPTSNFPALITLNANRCFKNLLSPTVCYFWFKNEERIWLNSCPMMNLHCEVKE